MRVLKQNLKRKHKFLLAMLMAFFTALIAFGIMPLNVFANTSSSIETESFIARINGKNVSVAADGIAMVSVTGLREPVEMEIPRFIFIDGEQIPVNDDRIENITPVVVTDAPITAFSADSTEADDLPTVGLIVAMSSSIPSNPVVSEIGQEYTHPAHVTMDGKILSSRRYVVMINNVYYESFCADPNLPGPENTNAVYELTQSDGSQFRTVLRYGFPINPALTQGLSVDDQSWNAYVTRVAVAYTSRPNAKWGGLTESTQKAISDRINGVGGAAAKENSPAISVNGLTNWEELGDMPQSPTFTLGHSRRTNCERNPFKFEWAQGTPSGTKLYVDGSHVATAPVNPTDIFTVNNPETWFSPISSFHLEMPQGSEKQTARINLVGVNNQYADRVFVMKNPNNTNDWQDIVFYIPEAFASASYSWEYEPQEELGRLRITKRSANTNSTLAGAVFRITGVGGFDVTRTAPTNGTIELINLTPGIYTVTETSPPPGYKLSEPTTQTVTVTAGSNAIATVDFVNQPTDEKPPVMPPVRIQKICALGRYNIPDALVRIKGNSSFNAVASDGQIWSINNTGIDFSIVLTKGHTLPVVQEATEENPNPVWFELEDGVLTIHNLPWGYYSVEEERSPDGYSLLPQHTAYGFWLLPPDLLIDAVISGNTPEFIFDENGNVNSILVTFENYPYSEIIAYKHCRETLEPLAGAHIRIEGFFVEGNAPVITDRTYVTDEDGKVIFTNLPAGTYTVSEVQAPPGYMLDELSFHSVDVSWGQRRFNALGQPVTEREVPVVRFYNTPMSYLLVEKIDGDTGEPLDGAIFMLEGLDQFGVRTTWHATSENGIAKFEGLFIPDETYILTEVQAPEGYVLMDGPIHHVMTHGRNTVVWRNWSNPALTIIKQCQDTGQRLAGAEFTLTAQGSGSPLPTDFPMITNENGEIRIPWTLFEGEAERTFIVTEVVPPPGYTLSDPNWQTVTMIAGTNNTVTFQNRRRPDLTIRKTDNVIRTHGIEGAQFTVYKITEPGSGYISGNPFTTDSNGEINLTNLHPGKYRITEIEAAPFYWLDPQEQNRSRIIEIRPNENYTAIFYNTLLPTLIIQKMNLTAMSPVGMTQFRIEYEEPLTGNVRYIATRMTNEFGQIVMPFVQPGWYRITEVRPAPGMSLNTNNSYRVFLSPGTNTYENIDLLHAITPGFNIGGQTTSMAHVQGLGGYDAPTAEHYNLGNFGDEDNSINLVSSPQPSPQSADIPFSVEEWSGMTETQRSQWLNSGVTVRDGNEFRTGSGGTYIYNYPLNSIVIKKSCSVTGQLLSGATFNLIHNSAGVSGTLGTVIGQYTTGASGIIVVTGLVPGSYTVVEQSPPPNFTLSLNNTQHVWLMPDGHSIVEVDFSNDPYGSLLINKICEITRQPLYNAEFLITRSDGSRVGTANGLHRTNSWGYILIENLPPDTYVVTEVQPPDGFQLTGTPQTIFVGATGETYSLYFTNRPYSTLIIQKLDGYSQEPLQGAVFEVRRANGEFIGEYTTDENGLIQLNGLLGQFIVTELVAPTGFSLDATPTRTVEVKVAAPTFVRFLNPRLGSLTIEKTDRHGTPLAGAQFRVTQQNGTFVGNYTTGVSGLINISDLPAGFYFVEETRAPQGFLISEAGRTVEVSDNNAAHVTFVNLEEPTITIIKIDEEGNPLSGARFEISLVGGNFRETVTTGQGGIATLVVPVGVLEVIETQAPTGFVITESARNVVMQAGVHRTETFVNSRIPSIVIEKVDTEGRPLHNAEFEIRTLDGALISRGTTNQGGMLVITDIKPGAYKITETRPPDGFAITESSRVVELSAGENRTERFINSRLSTIVINKIDGDTSQPLQGVVFEIAHYSGNGNAGERIRNPVDNSFEFITDSAGLINISSLAHGTYVAIEKRALPGYASAEPVVFVVGDNQDTTITIRNYKQPSVVIRKICGETGQPLSGVEFEIAVYIDNGRTGQRLKNYAVNNSYTFTSDSSGHIYLPTLPDGKYIATEIKSLPGYMLSEPVIFTVGVNGDQTVIIRNYRYADYAILKIDGDTNEPLTGVEFEIAHYLGSGRNGERLINPSNNTTTFVTDSAGMIHLPTIASGMYVAVETRALPGYSLAKPEIFTVSDTTTTPQDRVITIRNNRIADFVIRKTDGDSGAALAGVEFEIARYFGSGQRGERLKNPVDGSTTFITDGTGLIRLPNLEPETYIITETKALDGYILAESVIFVAGENAENTTIDIKNFRTPNLTIRKINSVTRQPIQGVVFQISRINGEKITNPQTGFYDFTTDRNGLIHLPTIEDGTFLVTETRAAHGYFGLEEAILFEINSQTRQQEYLLEIENTPASGLLIHKTDANTGAPLQGVEFEVRHADGRLVRGLIADQNQPNTYANSPNITTNNNFLTDHRGMIHLNHLEYGVYHITETRALPGYLLDSTVHVVTITPGRLSTLEVVNEQMAGLRLNKIDSVTKQDIPGVEFRIYDFITNQEVAGPFITDNNGVVDFTGILPSGRYTIRETREAPGYLRDTMARTVEFRAGMITEIIWENTREAGQIQITKMSSADNQVNGLPANSRLDGAVFEVRDWRTGNVLDQFITDARGVGVSRPLPLGRYLIEEIVSPAFYKRSEVIIDVTIEHSGQILRYEFFNEPANVGVEVRKTGPVEVMPGQPIVWNITTIANSSSIELSDFYVRDILPAHAVRLDRIFTGTFNQSVRYSVMFRTNLDDTWRVAFDNLMSTSNNALVMSPAALGLRSNEFVTEFMYSFGTVRAGFRSVESPRIEGTVLDSMQNGYEFVNRVDIGGRTGSEWVVGNNIWVVRVWRPTQGRHPRTGF